ncbi:MAG TPA: PucR family transcriptional regulator [Actinocrinis sp.]|nr:PucR family transcriptional regulator [Actinocrinis sp.]
MAEATAAQAGGGAEPVDEGARLTVADVLGLDQVAAWAPEVVAGAANLGRPVRWLHVAEALDVGVMLTGGEVVLTTGLLLGEERDQVEYVESMHRADVSAVVLGLGRAFRTTPPAMRRAAERRGMPLIVLHRPAPFARLTEEVHSRLVHGRFAALDLSDRIRSSLSVLNLAGASLQQLLDETASYSGCPVVMVNVAHRVLAAAGDRGAVSELMRDWDRVSRQVAVLADGAAATSGPDGWVVAPLEARGRRWGRLVLFGYRGTAEFGCVLANRAAEALTLHRLLGDRDRSWESQTAESLLTDLAAGAARPEQLLTRVRAAGLPVNRRTFVPVVLRTPAGGGPGGPGPGSGEEIPELIGRVLAEEALAALAAPIGPGVIAVLLSLPRDQQADTVVDRLAVQTHERLATRGWSAVLGVGAACAVLDEVPRAFVEAVHVADAAVADPPAGPAARLRDVRLRGLVRLLRDEPELQAFIERELGPLFEHQELLDVLRTYLRTGRNKSLAAQEHHVSRPALYRRLRSIEALLGVDLEDWDQLTSLYVAILAYEAQRASGGGPVG